MIKTSDLLAVVLLACTGATARAQIGKLPLLDPLPLAGECRTIAASEALKRDGVARIVMFESKHPVRAVSVGVNGSGRPTNLLAMANRPVGASKSAMENLLAFFSGSGRVTRGDRSYMTGGIPASTSEDRRSGLLSADTARVELLAKAVLKRCGA